MNILHIDSSPRPDSHSRQLSAAIVAKLVEAASDITIVRRDLAEAPLPHATPEYATTLSSPVTLASPLKGSLDLSEAVIQEVEAADAIVIGTPMYNLTIPSTLKAWIDHVLRAGRTFTSTRAGKMGLLEDRPVYIGIASGGTFTAERAGQPDFLIPYLTAVLNSIGLKNLQFFPLQATAFLDQDQATVARETLLTAGDFTAFGEAPCSIEKDSEAPWRRSASACVARPMSEHRL